jgi:hypothetical protein
MNSYDDQLNSILDGADKDQLSKYINDEAALDKLVKSLDQYQMLIKEKERIQLNNKNLAESNLNKEPVLQQLRSELSDAIREFDQAKKEFVELKETYDVQTGESGNVGLESVLTLLQTDAARAEEDTEKSAENFFSDYNTMHTEEELNSFQKQFLENRAQAYMKKIKAEKMKELIPNHLIRC